MRVLLRHLPLLALPLALLGCAAGELAFAGIPWESEAAEVRGMMAQRGFEFLSAANHHGDELYAGIYAGRRAVAVARLAEGRLVKLEIALQPETGLFRAMEDRLGTRYGDRSGIARVEDAQWGPGPGVRGRRSAWSLGSGAGESFLILEDRPDLGIVISFESPAWHAEFERRHSTDGFDR